MVSGLLEAILKTEKIHLKFEVDICMLLQTSWLSKYYFTKKQPVACYANQFFILHDKINFIKVYCINNTIFKSQTSQHKRLQLQAGYIDSFHVHSQQHVTPPPPVQFLSKHVWSNLLDISLIWFVNQSNRALKLILSCPIRFGCILAWWFL